MRIAFITRSAYGILGGADSYLMPAYVAPRHEVMVLSPVSPLSRDEIVYRNPELDVRNIRCLNGTELTVNVFVQLRSFAPDIVHVFHSRHCLRLLCDLRRLFPRAAWLIDFRSPPVVESSASRRALLARYFLCQLYVDHVFTHSWSTLRDNLPLRIRGATEVPPGVELARFLARGAPAATPRRFVYVGAVAAFRRLDVLVRGFGRFARGRAQKPVLEIIGGGDALPALRALAEREGLKDSVEFTGAVAQDEVYRRLQGCDAGIAWVPHALYARAPSLKLLEYSAAGLPFMASDTPGHIDYARRFGFHFTPFANTESGVARALERLSAGGSAAAAETAENLKAIARFDWRSIVDRDVLPVYEKLCRGHRRAPAREAA